MLGNSPETRQPSPGPESPTSPAGRGAPGNRTESPTRGEAFYAPAANALIAEHHAATRARAMFMGIHNSPPGFVFESLEGVGSLAPSNPELAANLKWLWQAAGADNKNLREDFHPLYDRPWLAAQEPALGSQVYPGLGVVFRAHPGADESWMFLRGGYP